MRCVIPVVLGIACGLAIEAQAKGRGASVPLVDLVEAGQVRDLCLATRPVSRVPFEGDAVDQGRDREAYEQSREAALRSLYRIRVASGGLRLGEYDRREGRLPVDLSRPLWALHGAVSLVFPVDLPIAFAIGEVAARDVGAALRAQTARVDAWFELRDDAGAVCSGSAASGVFLVNAVPVVLEIRDGFGQPRARAESDLADRHRRLVGADTGAAAVVVGAVSVEAEFEAGPIARRIDEAVGGPLRRCYQRRLAEDPEAAGTVVLGVETGDDGAVRSVSFIADSLDDEALHACVDEQIRALRLPGAALVRVPIEFRRLPR